MAKRRFTEEELEELGWQMIDRMLADIRMPEQPPQTGLEGLRQAALGWGRKKKGIGVPRLPSIKGGDVEWTKGQVRLPTSR